MWVTCWFSVTFGSHSGREVHSKVIEIGLSGQPLTTCDGFPATRYVKYVSAAMETPGSSFIKCLRQSSTCSTGERAANAMDFAVAFTLFSAPLARAIKETRSYTEYGTREGWVVPRVNVKEFTNQLREGATLVLSHIHEMHPPLTMLAESLERFFRATSGINVYVAWRDVHGFNIHRGKHDVFIAQVFGKKRWRLYAPIPEKPGKPPTEHTWESIINAGDLLYIPRGLWHAAAPLNEPSFASFDQHRESHNRGFGFVGRQRASLA
jgi:hypothetical protein